MAARSRSRFWWASDLDGYLASFDAGNDGPIPTGFPTRPAALDSGALGRRLLELPPSLVPELDVRAILDEPARELLAAPSAAALRATAHDHQALVVIDDLARLDQPGLVREFREATNRDGLIRVVSRDVPTIVVRAPMTWLASAWTELGARMAVAPFELEPAMLGVFGYRHVDETDEYERVFVPRASWLRLTRLGPALARETGRFTRDSFRRGDVIPIVPRSPRWTPGRT
jgi:hypothetical protein